MTTKFSGTATALITPFKQDKSVDFKALTNLINHQIANGIDYLVVLGSTGEAATLSLEEKEAIRRHFVKIVANRLPLVVGIGGNNTAQVVKALQEIDISDFDAVLSVSPSYNKPSQEGIYQHFKAISQASPLPVIMYNVPSRTGQNMTPETIVRLAHDFDNLIGVKDAAGEFAQTLAILHKKPKNFLVISGEDMLALSQTIAGGDGVISVLAQAFPKAFSSMIKLGLQAKVKPAFAIHYDLLPSINLIFEEGNPTGIKALLHQQGFCENELRLPLVKAGDELLNKISSVIAHM